jgi:ribosomal protein S19E (S16A)
MSEQVNKLINVIAAIARQVYFKRSIGLTALRDHFGGKCRRGAQPPHHRRAAGKAIRYCLK